jgi:hypothetical protein
MDKNKKTYIHCTTFISTRSFHHAQGIGYLQDQQKAKSRLINPLVQLSLARRRRASTASGTFSLRVKGRLIEKLRRLWDIKSRVLSEESIWLEHDADTLHWHDGEIFNTGVMG